MQWFAIEYRVNGKRIGVISYTSERNFPDGDTARVGYVGCDNMSEAIQRAKLMEQGVNAAYGLLPR